MVFLINSNVWSDLGIFPQRRYAASHEDPQLLTEKLRTFRGGRVELAVTRTEMTTNTPRDEDKTQADTQRSQ